MSEIDERAVERAALSRVKEMSEKMRGMVDKFNDAISALERIANSVTAPDADLRAIAKKALAEMGCGDLVKTTGPWSGRS